MFDSFDIRCNECDEIFSLSYNPDNGRYNLYNTLRPKRRRRAIAIICPQCGRIRQDGLTSRLAEAAMALRNASDQMAREHFPIKRFGFSERTHYFKVTEVGFYPTCCSFFTVIKSGHLRQWLKNIERFSCAKCGNVHPDFSTSRSFFESLISLNKESQRLPRYGLNVTSAKPIQYFEWKPRTIFAEAPRV